MKVVNFKMLACVSLLILTNVAHAIGLGARPSTIEMSVEPGKTYRQNITLANLNYTRPLALTIGLADWDMKANGDIRMSEPLSLESSAASWLRYSPGSITLQPRTNTSLTVEIAVPAKLENNGEHRAALVVSTLLPPESERMKEANGIWKRYQLVVLFYFSPIDGKARVAGKFENVRVEEGRWVVNGNFKNEGDVHARLSGVIKMTDSAGKEWENINTEVVVVNKIEINKQLGGVIPKDLPEGKYKISSTWNNIYDAQNPNITGSSVIKVEDIDFIYKKILPKKIEKVESKK